MPQRVHLGIGLACLLRAAVIYGQNAPQAEITNGLVHATIQLPDAKNGSYQGTRFDWSGIVSSVRYEGHEFVGKWHDVTDPKINDAVTGPAEEFHTNDSALGYDETKGGEVFPRIGIGAVRKPAAETKYQRFVTYQIVDPGMWTIHRKRNRIQFTHRLKTPDGYAYIYTKTLRLADGKAELLVEHALKNVGRNTIETSQYSHNFFAMDGQTVGPDVAVKFAFVPVASREMRFGAQLKGKEIVYSQDLQPKQTASADITGFGPSAKDYDIRVENRRLGTGVRISSDQPLEKLHFWSIRRVACPEPYVKLKIEPKHEAHWTMRYEFYTIPHK